MEAWVNNWLSACDAMGVQNVLYAGQLTTDGVGSPWVKSVIALDPSTQTYAKNGSAVPYLSYDNPDVSLFLEKDLATLYSYYGSHASWVGIGTGSSPNDPYYPNGGTFPDLGYSNLSISNFVDSPYYSSDVNRTGYLPNGELDPIWGSYKNVQPSITYSSGTWTTSSPVFVYGNGSSENYVEMKFELQTNTSSLVTSWYGSEVGSPGPLVLEFFGDADGSINLTDSIATRQTPGSYFSVSSGWQSTPDMPINLTAGYYWVRFSSPLSNKSNYYQVYQRDQVTNGFISIDQRIYLGSGYQEGSTVLWLKNQSNATLVIYPFQQAVINNARTQSFVAEGAFEFNTVFLDLSDRIWNPTNGTITVTDSTSGGGVLATGVLSQALSHGLTGWVPVTLNSTVTTVPGDNYQITLREPDGDYSWAVALRGISTDPASAGFQGQGSSWLFQIGYVNWVQGHLDFMQESTNGRDSVTAKTMDAIRFTPSYNETFQSFALLMANSGETGNYSNGYFDIGLWNTNASVVTSASPVGVPLSPVSPVVKVMAKDTPTNGWLNVTGLDLPVSAGRNYWIVLSANSSDTFVLARFTNSYAFDVQVSQNGGVTWSEPSEGPTDLGFMAKFSEQVLGNLVSGQERIQVSTSGYFAQPFISNTTSQITGVYLGPLVNTGGDIVVSINPDTGKGHPSLIPMGFGVYDTIAVTGVGPTPEFVQFSSVASLQKGKLYWLVVHPLNGTYPVFPLEYLPNAPGIPPKMPFVVSQDDGLTWTKLSNTTSTLVYQLASQAESLPQYSTKQLAGYLADYHSYPVSEGIIHGWTGYVAATESSLFGNIVSWLNEQAGRNFAFYTDGQHNVLNQLPAIHDVSLSNVESVTTCGQLSSDLTSSVPVSGGQYYEVANVVMLRSCEGSHVGFLLGQLPYMLGTGSTFGLRTSTRVLVVGDSTSNNITGFLSVAYDATYVQLILNPGLKDIENLSAYDAVVWTSHSNPFQVVGQRELADYVKGGGNLIFVQFGGNGSVTESVPSSLPRGNESSMLDMGFLASLLAHTSYGSLSYSEVNGGIRGENSNASIEALGYGSGRLYLVWFENPTVSQFSEPIVLLSNIIAKSNDLPFPFWYGSDANPGDSSLQYGVRNTGSGPILVWLTNDGEGNSTFSLHLNGTYYGVSTSWKTIDMNTLNVSIGNGSDISISSSIASRGWLPIYVVRASSVAAIDYSSAGVSGQFNYPGQSYFKLSTTMGQEVLLLLSSNTTAAQILTNDNLIIPEIRNAGAFENTTSGWIYLQSTNTLLVKYVSGGTGFLRLMDPVEPTPPVNELPVRTFLAIFTALVTAEFATLAYLSFKHHIRKTPAIKRTS